MAQVLGAKTVLRPVRPHHSPPLGSAHLWISLGGNESHPRWPGSPTPSLPHYSVSFFFFFVQVYLKLAKGPSEPKSQIANVKTSYTHPKSSPSKGKVSERSFFLFLL